MKITNISTKKIRIPLENPLWFSTRKVTAREFTLCEVFTEEDINGFSVIPLADPPSVSSIIENKLKKHVVGESLFAYEKIWEKMYNEVYRDRMGVSINAISAIDIAIWDAMSKVLKKPVYKILGGHKEKIQVYASGGYYREGKELNGLIEEVSQYIRNGYNYIKIKIGGATLEEDIKRIQAVRETIGPDIKLMLDANNVYTPYQAIKAGKEFEKFDIFWFEEPISPEDIPGYKKVASSINIPIASGELVYTRFGFRELINDRIIDIAQPDCAVVGGVTEFIKVMGMASAQNIPLSPHWNHEIHMHMVAAYSNAILLEYVEKKSDIRKEELLYEESIEPKNGFIDITNEPGFGRKLSQKSIEQYSVT